MTRDRIVVARDQGRDGHIGDVVGVDERDLPLSCRGPQHAQLADRVRPTKCIQHEAGCLNERECYPTLADCDLTARVPRSRPHPGLHVQRGELDHMPDSRGFRSDRNRAISRLEIRTVGHEEDTVDTGERGRQRRTWLLEVPHMDIDLVAEEHLCLLRIAHENGRPLATCDKALGDSRPDVPGAAEDQMLHLRLLQPLITSSANRF